MNKVPFLESTASFSRCRRFRYTLTRSWDANAPSICWILLNPSTADEFKLDPTLTRCFGFSQAWGYGHMVVVNLFALRSTYPVDLYEADDPVGSRNNRHIRQAGCLAHKVVVGWGVHGKLLDRGPSVSRLLNAVGVFAWCLGRTKEGHPKHPLYVAASTKLVQYELQR